MSSIIDEITELNNEPSAQARNSLILNAHFIEKEMVMNSVDFPTDKFLKNIASSTEILLKSFPTYDEFALLTGCRLLSKYDKEHKYLITNDIDEYLLAKSNFIDVGRKKGANNGKQNKRAIHFLRSRSSYRLFEDRIIPENTIREIIETASNAPSACNRQPCKVIYATNAAENDVIRTVVPDKFVCKKIPNFFVVVCDKSFFNKGEELQCYINGGIFLNNLLLSLEAHGLGATAFQTPYLAGEDKNNKELFGLNNKEFILATIGYGVPMKNALVAAAYKKPVNYLAKKLEIKK